MHAICAFLALFATPFWEAKAPADWTSEEVVLLLSDSPWARAATAGSKVQSDAVQTYLASAAPMRQAELEAARRFRRKRVEQGDPDDYREFLEAQASRSIVLAVRFPDWNALADAKESRQMEEDTLMRVGRRKYKMSGHFPPTPSDPYLRLVFPRDAVKPGDKTIVFELYLPGVPNSYRMAEYLVRDLVYRGKPEM